MCLKIVSEQGSGGTWESGQDRLGQESLMTAIMEKAAGSGESTSRMAPCQMNVQELLWYMSCRRCSGLLGNVCNMLHSADCELWLALRPLWRGKGYKRYKYRQRKWWREELLSFLRLDSQWFWVLEAPFLWLSKRWVPAVLFRCWS